jgi:hypothetical protein
MGTVTFASGLPDPKSRVRVGRVGLWINPMNFFFSNESNCSDQMDLNSNTSDFQGIMFWQLLQYFPKI